MVDRTEIVALVGGREARGHWDGVGREDEHLEHFFLFDRLDLASFAERVKRRGRELNLPRRAFHGRNPPRGAAVERESPLARARLRNREDVRHLAPALVGVAHRVVRQVAAEAEPVDVRALDRVVAL